MQLCALFSLFQIFINILTDTKKVRKEIGIFEYCTGFNQSGFTLYVNLYLHQLYLFRSSNTPSPLSTLYYAPKPQRIFQTRCKVLTGFQENVPSHLASKFKKRKIDRSCLSCMLLAGATPPMLPWRRESDHFAVIMMSFTLAALSSLFHPHVRYGRMRNFDSKFILDCLTGNF